MADPTLQNTLERSLWIQGVHLIELAQNAIVAITPDNLEAATAACTGPFATFITNGTLVPVVPADAPEGALTEYHPPPPSQKYVCIPMP